MFLNPLFWKVLIMFSFLIVNRKHNFPYCLLSSDLSFFLYKGIVGYKGQKVVLKVNWGTLKFSRVDLNIQWFESDSVKPNVVRSAPLTGGRDKVFIEKTNTKQSNYLINYILKTVALFGKPSWLFVMGCS